MTASFQSQEDGFNHQNLMPEVPSPETLISQDDIIQRLAAQLPESVKKYALRPNPFEFRPIEFYSPFDTPPQEPFRYIWFKAKGQLPDIPSLHNYLLGYASDYNFLPQRSNHMAVALWRETYRLPQLTILCGTTAPLKLMTGYSML